MGGSPDAGDVSSCDGGTPDIGGHCATAGFPMLLADHCPSVAQDTNLATSHCPDFPASLTQVSRPLVTSRSLAYYCGGRDRNVDDEKNKKDSSVLSRRTSWNCVA
jgi:hypothetical protein